MKKIFLMFSMLVIKENSIFSQTNVNSSSGDYISVKNSNLADNATTGSVNLNFWTTTSGQGTKISTFKETFNTAGLSFFTQYGYVAPIERMRISATGNVSIGTANTSSTLSIRNSQLSNDASSGLVDLSFHTTDNGVGTKISTFKETFNTAGLSFFTQYGYVAPIERMRISATGNVSIGTVNTSSTLSIRNSQLSNDANSGEVDLSFHTTDNGFGTKISTFKETFNTAGLAFFTQFGYTTPIERMRISATGQVSIGSLKPTTSTFSNYKLSVDGKIVAKEIQVQIGSWADYVFKKEYKLKTLKEVEEFINENQHLPEVPSESEVVENGVNVTEMQKIQMQKIEELTLYIIEQNKKIESLQIQVFKLLNK